METVTTKRIRPYHPEELERDTSSQMAILPLREIVCLLRNAGFLIEHIRELVRQAEGVPLNDRVIHMTIDDAEACAERIQKLLPAVRR